MATTITAGNATNGAAISSDNTGILELKSGTGSGTTAVTIGTNQAVTFAGRSTNPTTISVGNATPSTSGSGITFPATQSASSDANTLDDYEEGTWTPVLTFGGAAGVTTYGQQNGTWTKIGNTVTVRGYFRITTKSAATGSARITGLPFATRSGTEQYHTASNYMAGQSITGAPMSYIDPNDTIVQLGQSNGSTGFASLSNTNFSNGGDFIFQATYLTN